MIVWVKCQSCSGQFRFKPNLPLKFGYFGEKKSKLWPGFEPTNIQLLGRRLNQLIQLSTVTEEPFSQRVFPLNLLCRFTFHMGLTVFLPSVLLRHLLTACFEPLSYLREEHGCYAMGSGPVATLTIRTTFTFLSMDVVVAQIHNWIVHPVDISK